MLRFFLIFTLVVAMLSAPIANANEPEKEVLYRQSGGTPYYVVLGLWGGNHVVKSVTDGSFRKAWDEGHRPDGYGAWAWCEYDVPPVTNGFQKFGLYEGSTRWVSHYSATRTKIVKCLKKAGWVDDNHAFCNAGGEICAYWDISEGCIVNTDWLVWATENAGRNLDWKNQGDLNYVCGF